jgi:hypothetical protein
MGRRTNVDVGFRALMMPLYPEYILHASFYSEMLNHFDG